MGKKKNIEGPELRVVSKIEGPRAEEARQEPRPTPSVIEYQPVSSQAGLKWRVDRWELFRGEFPGIEAETLPLFHQMVSQASRAWLICRRLFGIMPVVLPLNGNPDDFRTWSRSELCENLGIEEGELRAELEAVRSGIANSQSPMADSRSRIANGTGSAGASPYPAGVATLETDDEVLKRAGFTRALFDCRVRRPGEGGVTQTEKRSVEEGLAEQKWFCQRLREWDRLLRNSVAQRVALQALQNELRLKRAEADLTFLTMGTKEFRELRNDIEALEVAYQNQLQKLDELCPWFNTTSKQLSMTGAVSELVQAVMEYRARGDTRLVDGVFNAYEIQVLLRTSLQFKDPKYRLGWVTYINMSRQFLWDPEAKLAFKGADLAKLDAGFREGVRRFQEETGEFVPDLEKDGEQGEYEDLYVPEVVGEAVSVVATGGEAA
jgi:hypothetical protein